MSCEVLDSLVGLEVVLDVEGFALGVDPLESMGAVPVHVSVTIWSSSVCKEDGHLMKSFWALSPKVPSHIRISQVSLRVSLLRVDEVRELYWVFDEENWGIVSNDIVNSFFSIELQSEPSWIPFCISCSFFSCNSRKPQKARGLLSNMAQEVSLGVPISLQ